MRGELCRGELCTVNCASEPSSTIRTICEKPLKLKFFRFLRGRMARAGLTIWLNGQFLAVLIGFCE
jgi:hypothetical protein